jgi:CBS domain-containing protein
MNAPITAILDRKGRTVFSVSPTMTVAEAVAEMNSKRVGSVLVLEAGELVGIFTERDVLRRVVGAGVNPRTTVVFDVMTKGVITISPDATVEETMVLFTEKRWKQWSSSRRSGAVIFPSAIRVGWWERFPSETLPVGLPTRTALRRSI